MLAAIGFGGQARERTPIGRCFQPEEGRPGMGRSQQPLGVGSCRAGPPLIGMGAEAITHRLAAGFWGRGRMRLAVDVVEGAARQGTGMRPGAAGPPPGASRGSRLLIWGGRTQGSHHQVGQLWIWCVGILNPL